jgi:hypothetical protein
MRHGFDGQVLLPDEPGHHEAQQIWNAMVDRRPAAIARCASPADVAAAVGFPAPRSWSWGALWRPQRPGDLGARGGR